jgi:dihydrofolate reductase
LINLFATICKERGMGTNGCVPWMDSLSLGRFKVFTKGQIVVMSGGVWRGLPVKDRPIPGRDNFIVTNNPEPIVEELSKRRYTDGSCIEVMCCWDCCYEACINKAIKDSQSIWIMGGQSAYNAFIHKANYLYLTEISREYESDRWFPEFEQEFKLITSEKHPDDGQISFNVYQRIV